MNSKLFVFASLLGALGCTLDDLSEINTLLKKGGMSEEDITFLNEELVKGEKTFISVEDMDVTFHYTTFVKELVEELKG